MFDTVDKYRPIFQILLGLIGLSFITFGVRSFTQAGSDYIVEVGNQKISTNEVRKALQNQQLPATPANTKQIYNTLIRQAYLINGAEKMSLSVSNEQIKQTIMNTPIFQDNGKFSVAKFNTYLRNTGQNEEQLIELVQKQFYTQSVINLAIAGNFVSNAQIKTFLNIYQSVHHVQFASFNPNDFISQVKVNDTALKDYYDEHSEDYTLPEAVKYSYVRITPDVLVKQEKISEAQIKAYFDAHKGKPEQRDIAHILISVPAGATPEQKAILKAKAEKILAELKQDPSKFSQYASEYSQDKTSAQNGGDIGWVERNGNLVKPFEDQAFELTVGQISPLVETQFGYHIIKVLGILKNTNLADDTPAIMLLLQQQQAQKNRYSTKDKLAEVAFNQAKDLKPVADIVHIPVQHQDDKWLTHAEAKANLPEDVAEALFSNDVLQKRNNSDVIDVNGTLWVVRVDNVREAKVQPFTDVENQVKQDYTNIEAKKLADQSAEQTFTKLQKGEEVGGINWGEEQDLTLNNAMSLFSPQDTVQFMQAIPKDNKPAYFLMNQPSQKMVTLVRVNSIKLPDMNKSSKAELFAINGKLQQQEGFWILQSYLNYLEKNISLKQGLQKLNTTE